MSDPVLEFPFAGGIDESSREELVNPAVSFIELRNVRQAQRGGAEKRLGFDVLPRTRQGAVARSAGRRIFDHKRVPAVIDGTFIDTYVGAASTSVLRSRVPEAAYRVLDIPISAATAVVNDSEVCNGYVAVTYWTLNAGACSVAVLEAATGAVLRSPEAAFGIGNRRAIVGSYGDRFFLAFVWVASDSSIEVFSLDTQAISGGWSLVDIVASSSSTLPSCCSLTDRVAVAYGTASGTNRVSVKTFNAVGALESTTVPTSSVTPDAVDVHGSIAGTLWIAWNEGTDIKVRGLDADSLASVLATTDTALGTDAPVTDESTTYLRICEGPTSGTARVWAAKDINSPDTFVGITVSALSMATILTIAGAAVAGAQTNIYGVLPSSRPFLQGDRYYMTVFAGATNVLDLEGDATFPTNTQGLCILVDWTDDVPYLRPVANVDPGLVSLTSLATPDSKFTQVGAGKWQFAYQAIKRGGIQIESLVSGNVASGARLLEVDFTSRDRWQSADHANSTFLGGALLGVFDSERVTEVGFLVRPTKPILTSAELLAFGITGTFRYVAVYEDIDSAGNWVVSGVSAPSDALTISNRIPRVEVLPLTVSSRIARGCVQVAFYRTLTGGAPPYYRVGVVDNDPTSTIVVLTQDLTDDSELATRPKLYAPNLPGADGEALDRRAPPGLMHIVSYNGMLVGAFGESVYHSGQEVYGEATWFDPLFQQPITGGGDITAMAVQDGTLYAFKADRIFSITGDAPSDNGTSGGLGTPRQLATNVGCIEANSIVVTELGIFFRSTRGIELLIRSSASVQWVGDKIQNTLAAFPVLTSAVLDTRNDLVRFALVESEASGVASGEGITLIFDLTMRVWQSVDDYPAAEPVQSAAMVYLDGAYRYAWLGSDGEVHFEKDTDDAAAHLDDTDDWITQRAVISWVHIAGLQGEQFIDQVLLLAERVTGHDLTISLAFDYSSSFTSSKTFTAAQIATLAREWLVKEVEQTTSNAIRVRIEDATPSSGSVDTGKGGTWVCLTLNGQPHRGPKRSTGVQRGGLAA